MILKLFACVCKIDEIKESAFSLNHETTFGCCYHEKVNFSATVCEKCPCYSYFFHKNYYTSITCFCAYVHKDNFCSFSENLKDHFNYRALKPCILVDGIDSFPIDIVPMQKCLRDVKAQPFFVFDAVH